MDQARRQSDAAIMNKDLDIQTRLRFTSDCIPNEDRDESNVDAIKYHYGEILKMIGENPEREGERYLFILIHYKKEIKDCKSQSDHHNG